jgi:hypothetical protein
MYRHQYLYGKDAIQHLQLIRIQHLKISTPCKKDNKTVARQLHFEDIGATYREQIIDSYLNRMQFKPH